LLHGLVAQNRSVLMATHDHGSLSTYPGRVLMVGKGKVHEV
jgi:ABC-type ATPase involved in cell division